GSSDSATGRSERACKGAAAAACAPALTVTVLTSTGRMGSVEPAAAGAEASAVVAVLSPEEGSGAAALAPDRTGTLLELARAKPGFASLFVSGFLAGLRAS